MDVTLLIWGDFIRDYNKSEFLIYLDRLEFLLTDAF